jgi:hypothetical protein
MIDTPEIIQSALATKSIEELITPEEIHQELLAAKEEGESEVSTENTEEGTEEQVEEEQEEASPMSYAESAINILWTISELEESQDMQLLSKASQLKYKQMKKYALNISHYYLKSINESLKADIDYDADED